MTCRDFIDCVIDYLDGGLDVQTRARAHQHLAVCGDCPKYLTQYCETIQASAAAYTGKAGDLPEDLVRTILASRDTGAAN